MRMTNGKANMSNETKDIFFAPWQIEEVATDSWDIIDSEGVHRFSIYGEKYAKRFFRLPELYDAMVEALEIICGIPGEDACEHCSNASVGCRIREWRELLKKIKVGK